MVQCSEGLVESPLRLSWLSFSQSRQRALCEPVFVLYIPAQGEEMLKLDSVLLHHEGHRTAQTRRGWLCLADEPPTMHRQGSHYR